LDSGFAAFSGEPRFILLENAAKPESNNSRAYVNNIAKKESTIELI